MKAAGLLLQAGQFEDAQSRAQKALTIDPKSVEAQLVSAHALAGLRQFDEAITQIEQAIAVDPDRSVSYQSLANVEQERGNQDKAEAAFRKAVETNPPGSVTARLALGSFYLSRGRQADAHAEFMRAVKEQPKNPMANRALAILYFGTGQAAAGEPYLKTFAEVAPGGTGRLLLAKYYISRQRFDEARKTLEGIERDGRCLVRRAPNWSWPTLPSDKATSRALGNVWREC